MTKYISVTDVSCLFGVILRNSENTLKDIILKNFDFSHYILSNWKQNTLMNKEKSVKTTIPNSNYRFIPNNNSQKKGGNDNQTNMDIGKNGEIDVLSKFPFIQDNQKEYTLQMTNDWILVGKIDGIHVKENKLVEIKTRINSFVDTIIENEMIQIQIYLQLSKYDQCILIEKHKDEYNNRIIIKDDEMITDILKKLYILIQNLEYCYKHYKNLLYEYTINTNYWQKVFFVNIMKEDFVNNEYRNIFIKKTIKRKKK